MEIKPVKWRGFLLGEVKVYDESDWKGQLPPGKKDFENVHAYQAREALREALERTPTCPDRDEINDDTKPWPQKLLEAICKTLLEKSNREFEERVMQYYLDTYGMNQIVQAFGVDEGELKQKLDNMKKEKS